MVEKNSWENYNLNKDAVTTLELEILAKKKERETQNFRKRKQPSLPI